MTKTPNQTTAGGATAGFAASGSRTEPGIGGEIAYAAMLSTPGPRAAAKNRWRADRRNDDSMWPVLLLVMAMIGTAAVASSAYLTDREAARPPGTRLAATGAATGAIGGADPAVSVDRADAPIPPAAQTATPVRRIVRTARADLRAGPSLDAEVVAGLRQGQAVLAISVADAWTGVRLTDSGGTFGWIRSSTLNQD